MPKISYFFHFRPLLFTYLLNRLQKWVGQRRTSPSALRLPREVVLEKTTNQGFKTWPTPTKYQKQSKTPLLMSIKHKINTQSIILNFQELLFTVQRPPEVILQCTLTKIKIKISIYCSDKFFLSF